ncbi:MAG: prepilin-type N-terminal cleavage/methylation domain-containing protein [Nitrospiraceae bacterium]
MKQSGFTLIELLVTMTIVMVMASVAYPLHRVSATRAKEMELRQHLRVMRAALDAFKTDWNREGDTLLGTVCLKNRLTCKDVAGPHGYPVSLDVLLGVELTGQEATIKRIKTRRYLRTLPVDPMTGATKWRMRCYQDPPTAESWCGTDVYDVSTLSDGAAADGTKYRAW